MLQRISDDEQAVLGVYHAWTMDGRTTTAGHHMTPDSIPEATVVAELRGSVPNVREVARKLHKRGLLRSEPATALALGEFKLADGRTLSVRRIVDDGRTATIEAAIDGHTVARMSRSDPGSTPDRWASLTAEGIQAAEVADEPAAAAPELPEDLIPVVWLRGEVSQKTVRGEPSKLAKWLERRGVTIYKAARKNYASRAAILPCFRKGSKVHELIERYSPGAE